MSKPDKIEEAVKDLVEAGLVEAIVIDGETKYRLTKKGEEDADIDADGIVCPRCGCIEGTSEYGTVGDGFDGYCPSCADEREESGEVEIG